MFFLFWSYISLVKSQWKCFFRPKFRSYVPEDETLKENVIPSAKPGDVESEVKDQLNAANSRVVIEDLVSKTSFIYNNITVFNLYLYYI